MFNEMTYRKASKFGIFLEYENPSSFSVLCRRKPRYSSGEKNIVARNEKRKKCTWDFVF